MTAPTASVQLDLFAGDPEVRRLVDGLRCLRDDVPEAMDVLLHLAHWRRVEHHGVGLGDEWAYSILRDGFHYERRADWCGLRSRLRRITWAELAEQLANDPRRPRILAWAQSLAEPSWKDLYRPFELWPNPDRWHPSYITGDHARPGWQARITAWRALLAICTDAITRLEVSA